MEKTEKCGALLHVRVVFRRAPGCDQVIAPSIHPCSINTFTNTNRLFNLPITDAQLKSKYDICGPIPRHVLSSKELRVFRATLTSAITAFTRDNITVNEVLCGGETSHKIILITPIREDRPAQVGDLKRIVFLTPYIAGELAKAMLEKERMGSQTFYKSLLPITEGRTTAGWLFEYWSHSWLVKDRSVQIQSLEKNGQPENLQLLESTTGGFNSLGDLGAFLRAKPGSKLVNDALCGKYQTPVAKTLPAGDGILILRLPQIGNHPVKHRLVIFQMTLNKEHSFQSSTLGQIYDVLPDELRNETIWFVWVVPGEEEAVYKKRSVKDDPQNI